MARKKMSYEAMERLEEKVSPGIHKKVRKMAKKDKVFKSDKALFKKAKKIKKANEKTERKIEKVMHEYKHGKLHSGSKKGPKVRSRKQAVAIALSEARRAKKRK